MPTYSNNWSSIASRLRREFPLCLDPLQSHPDQLLESQEVHHIIPAKFKWEYTNEDFNLLPLCRSCHEQVERLASQGIFLAFNYSNQLKASYQGLPTHYHLLCKKGEFESGNSVHADPGQQEHPCGMVGWPTDWNAPDLNIEVSVETLFAEHQDPGCSSNKTSALPRPIYFLSRPDCHKLPDGKVFCRHCLTIKKVKCPRCLVSA